MNELELTNDEILAVLTLPTRDAVLQAWLSALALEDDRKAGAL